MVVELLESPPLETPGAATAHRTSMDRASANGDSAPLCPVPETGSLATSRSEGPLPKTTLVRRPTAPNPAGVRTVSALSTSPARSLNRCGSKSGSKSVRFSASSDVDDDDDEDWLKDVDMLSESGRVWTSLSDFRNLKVPPPPPPPPPARAVYAQPCTPSNPRYALLTRHHSPVPALHGIAMAKHDIAFPYHPSPCRRFTAAGSPLLPVLCAKRLGGVSC